MKSKQEIQLEAVKAILNGELLLEEAMAKYGVKDKRTMTAWIKKTMILLHASQDVSSPKSGAPFNAVSQEYKPQANYQYISRENALQKTIVTLQDQIRKLEEKNALLIRHRDLLTETVSSLPLRLRIQQKGDK